VGDRIVPSEGGVGAGMTPTVSSTMTSLRTHRCVRTIGEDRVPHSRGQRELTGCSSGPPPIRSTARRRHCRRRGRGLIRVGASRSASFQLIDVAGGLATRESNGSASHGPSWRCDRADWQCAGDGVAIACSGDCLTWDRSAAATETREATAVPCDQPHRLEVAATTPLPSQVDHYLSVAEWDALVTTQCRAISQDLFGGEFDPNGRNGPSGFYPSQWSWSLGDRQLVCGVASN
jgi:hypothetical protein